MGDWMTTLFWAIAGYLLGSLSSAVMVCRLFGLPDPRTLGSRNPGATNVYRIGGKVPAALTFLGDALKGFLPVAMARAASADEITLLFAGLAAFLGHLYPLFFGFKGGKGVATAFGVLLAWQWVLGLILLAIWIAVFLLFRISSLSALTAALIAPLVADLLQGPSRMTLSVTTISLLLIWRHRENIGRLLRGEER